MRGDAGRYDTGVAPLEVDARYWRPKPLEEIVDIPLAPVDEGGAVWRGRAGERKPLWAIMGEPPPYDWRTPAVTERDASPAYGVPLASDTAPSDKPAPEALSDEVPDPVLNAWAFGAHREGKPGLYVTGHRIFGVGPIHTAIEYVAENGQRQWISAGSRMGRLVSGQNGERDTDDPNRNFALGVIAPPPGLTDGEYYQHLKDADIAYGDNADYDLFPEIMNGYNSNGFVRGLLDDTGGSYSVDFDRLVGGDSPVPPTVLHPESPRQSTPPSRKPKRRRPAFGRR
jgi:hypothetical protein